MGETSEKHKRRNSFFAKVSASPAAEKHTQKFVSIMRSLPGSAPESGPKNGSVSQVHQLGDSSSADRGSGTGTGAGFSTADASQHTNVTGLLTALLEAQERMIEAQERTNQLLLTQIQHSGQFDIDDEKAEDNSWKVDLM